MIQLNENDIRQYDRQSSKGNQLKWFFDNRWYKADYTGYEGLTEYVVSKLLQYTDLIENEYIMYQTEEINYKYLNYKGCSSKDFLPQGWQLITLERLFQNTYGESLNKALYRIEKYENRIQFLVEQTIRITGLDKFGKYMSKLLTVDAFFLNEDRHTHNIAVLMNADGQYKYCPIFDNGAALLSDTTLDYPMQVPIAELIPTVHSKTFCTSFDEQLDIVEKMYGQHIAFKFGEKEIEKVLEEELYYSDEIKNRVMEILLEQRRKYRYLFK
ncbi:MAG: hypothetical protein IJ326_09175 [Lachnospiraceae bacterium]|nr:hypothetical protein [Lachnospiraceae bacterium]